MARIERRAPRERSAIREIHTDKRLDKKFVVYVDCQLTRRKRHHMICDGRDSVLFRSRLISDCIDWLADEGELSYSIVTDRDRYTISCRRNGR